MGAATSIDRTGLSGVDTALPSELPAHTAATSEYCPLSRAGVVGRRDVAGRVRSLASLLVPVLSVAGRRVPFCVGQLNLPQNGFCLGSVLPARMSVMM